MNRRFLRLEHPISAGIWACALVLVVCLSVRLFWRATQMESGMGALGLQWRDATLGWVLGAYVPIDEREPAEQAEFLLGEVDRVLEAHPNDAALAMGAALVLDSPGVGFMWRHTKPKSTGTGVGASPDLDVDVVTQAENVFEQRCKCRCVELAAAAARLEPANVQWSRLYALLLYRQSLYSDDDSPRDPDWVNVLDECARHDPDNALYDYLAARFYWDAAADADYSGTEGRLVIKDAEKFKQGILRFERGQAKRCFAVGDGGFTVVADFLSHTPIPVADRERIVNSGRFFFRRTLLLSVVLRWQALRADEQASAGNVAAAVALCRQNLHAVDQYERGGAGTAYDLVADARKVEAAWKMKTFADVHDLAASDAEKRQFQARLESAIVDQQVVTMATNNWASGKGPPAGTSRGAAFASGLLAGTAPPVIVLLLLVGLLATLLSRRLAPGESPVVGPVAEATMLALATAVTVTLFGLAPAEIIGRQVQAWFFTAVVLSMPVAAVLWIGWWWLRRRLFQFSIRALLILTLVVSLFLSLLVVIRPAEGYLATFPFPLSIPARGWKGLDADFYHNAVMPFYGGEWAWVALQWTLYGGAYWTLLVWAGLLVAWHRRKARKASRQTDSAIPNLRRRVGSLLGTLGRPSLATSVLLLIVYLSLAPGVLQQIEDDFQQKMAFARYPEAHWAEVEQAVQTVRSDEQVMATLRAGANAEASQSAVPDGPQ
ncbi:MAG: hypothetical protein NTW96_21115 [Planctomycetia bacterium]|nr:hypothetical protein [Planctomycetia bacterium]